MDDTVRVSAGEERKEGAEDAVRDTTMCYPPVMQLAIRKKTKVKPGGVVEISDEGLEPGSSAEVIVFVEQTEGADAEGAAEMTAADLLESGLVGLWADRSDMTDSAALARDLRREAEHRRGEP
jgi:hypothetical protein